MPFVLSFTGFAMLAVAGWSRSGVNRRSRWWVGSRLNESAALFWVPGVALILFAAGFLSTHRSGSSADWTFWFVPLAVVGGTLALWGALLLPIPKWYTPRWTRDEQTTMLESRVLGLIHRR